MAIIMDTKNSGAQHYINKQFYKNAEIQWQRRISESKSHSIMFSSYAKLKCQLDLDIPSFRGRTLLTKLRVNDLPLQGAGYNAKVLSIQDQQ